MSTHINTHYKKSLLTLAVMTSLGIINIAQAGDSVICNTDNCANDIRDVHIGSTFRNSLTTNASPPPNNSNLDPKKTDSLENNEVTLDYTGNSQELINVVFGALSTDEADELKTNKVFIKNGKVIRDVYGGNSLNANVTNNEVNVSGGVIGNDVMGGKTEKGSASGNKVFMSNGNVGSRIIGGAAYDGKALNNNVTIEGGEIGGYVVGGLGDLLIKDNKVDITDVTVDSEVFGGKSWENEAQDNLVTLENTAITSDMYGGHAKGNASGNTVNLNNNSTVGDINLWSGEVHAGHSDEGDANNNTLNINDGTIGFYSYGGYSKKGNANANTITFTSGTAGNIMHGGFSDSIGDTNENTITIDGGTAKWGVFGGFSWEGEANNNTVTLNSGFAEMGLFGAKTPNNATGNIVNVNGGIIGSIHPVMGRAGGVFGAKVESLRPDGSATGNATENTVNFNDGELKVEHLIGGYTGQGDSTENVVNITGGTINNNVYGGFSWKGTATNNTVTIKNNPTFGDETILNGGGTVKDTPTTGNITDGNTLNLHSKDVTVSDVKNFENYNFYLDNNLVSGSTVLKLTSTDATDLSTSKYGVGVKTGTTALRQGYTVTLIESATTLTLSSPNPANDTTNMTDITSGYEFRLSVKDGNKLVAELPYTVTIENSNPSKGSVNNTGEQAYRDETITFNATPNPGYLASASSTCGTTGSWSGDTYTSTEITKECTITVNWEEINYTIGGKVSGLNGSVTLQNNAGNNLTLNADGEFTFTATAVHDDNYSVTVSSQPAGQECTVDNGSGTISDSNISNITVTCSDVTIGTIFSDSFE